jgi:predicted helicase
MESIQTFGTILTKFREAAENPTYPLQLFQRVITVSLETLEIVRSLPRLSGFSD